MRCTKCGYEARMQEFSWARSCGSCCSRVHIRQCPKCKEVSPCDPLREEVWEEKFRLKKANDVGNPQEKEERAN